MKDEAVNLVEPLGIPDTFVTGACPGHVMGGNMRLTLFVEQRPTFGGPNEHPIVAKLVGSRGDMLEIAAAILRACSEDEKATTDPIGTFLDITEKRH